MSSIFHLLKTHIQFVLLDRYAVFFGILWGVCIRAIGMHFIHVDLIRGNMGAARANAEVMLHLILSILFGFFIAWTVYKTRLFRTIPSEDAARGGVWGFLGILVSWCSACSITLASYVGLASLLVHLPFKGLELKIVGIVLLWRATRRTYRYLTVCERKPL